MRTLIDIFTEQKDFQRLLYDIDSLSESERISFSKEYILSVHRELGEVLNVLPWKSHRSIQPAIDREELLEELTDSLKYLLNIYLLWDITAESLVEGFWKKSAKVRERLKTELSK